MLPKKKVKKVRRKKRAPTRSTAMPVQRPSDPVFSPWLNVHESSFGRHKRVCLSEISGTRTKILDALRKIVRQHYVSPEILGRRLAALGAPKTALLKEHFPTTKRARSGDLGEIFATEFTARYLSYDVPIFRLRWKDGREMALRGDDIVAMKVGAADHLSFLKAESKSRINISNSVVTEASETLDRNNGRPSRHSVLFVANRLREHGDDDKALLLERSVLSSFRGSEIRHLLFTFCGNNPDDCLGNHLDSLRHQINRFAVALRIEDHADFIKTVFEGM